MLESYSGDPPAPSRRPQPSIVPRHVPKSRSRFELSCPSSLLDPRTSRSVFPPIPTLQAAAWWSLSNLCPRKTAVSAVLIGFVPNYHSSGIPPFSIHSGAIWERLLTSSASIYPAAQQRSLDYNYAAAYPVPGPACSPIMVPRSYEPIQATAPRTVEAD